MSATILGLGMLVGCSGRIGGAGQSDPGSTGGDGATAGTGAGSGGSSSNGSNSGGANGGGSGATGTGGGGDAIVAGQFDLRGAPKYYRFIRLSNAQWAKAVQQVLNLSAPTGLEQNFETPVSGTTDFTNNELVLGFDSRNWQDYESAAETLAAQVTATDAALAKVYTGTDAAGFITTMGRRIYRRPLATAEQSTYMTLYNSGSTLMGSRSTFAKGASLVLRAMLQSPYFLYRTEMGAKGQPLSAYEIAAKLSLWLRGAPPDDKTLDMAAGSGKLDTADGAAALATTMVGEPAAATVMRQFHSEWLRFGGFSQITKVNVPSYSESLNAEYEEASNRFFDNIFSQGLGVKDIFTSTTGFYGPGMAKLYGVSAPAAGAYGQSDLGSKRAGYFSQMPYLSLYGMNDEPSSILRGVSLNQDVVCATLGPPAAMIPPIPALQPGQTNRQRIDKLTMGCGMECHNNMINPLGFAFEHFDGMGLYRDTENGGLAIDSSGKYTFADGTTKNWNDAAGLMQVLASTPQTHTCYAKKLASYGLQRSLVPSDMPMLTSLTSVSMAQGGSIKQLIVSLVKTDTFRTHVSGGSQ